MFCFEGNIMEIGGGIRGEQKVECGKDQVNEEEVSWGCDSIIKVGPFSKTSASLVITEVQMERQFCVQTYMKGKKKRIKKLSTKYFYLICFDCLSRSFDYSFKS